MYFFKYIQQDAILYNILFHCQCSIFSGGFSAHRQELIIQPTIDNKLEQEMEAYYDNPKKRLDNMQNKQKEKKQKPG
jgi:hypothetical protein